MLASRGTCLVIQGRGTAVTGARAPLLPRHVRAAAARAPRQQRCGPQRPGAPRLAPRATHSAGSQGHGPGSHGSSGHSSGSGGSGGAAAPAGAPAPQSGPPGAAEPSVVLQPIYFAIFCVVFVGGLLFASMSLQLTGDMAFGEALARITRRIFRSIAFRQLVVIAVAIFLVRFALNNVLRLLAQWSSSPVPWDKSKLYFVMKEVYSPLELLLFVAGCCTIADSFLPQLIQVPKATVNAVVRAALSMSFILGAATVVHNLKSRFCKEQAWGCEMQGNVTSQRRWEAYDKLGTFGIYTITFFLSIQALGLEVRSVLAIGGIGGLAIGLAGREICENLLNGFLLMTTMPFEVGDEILFNPNGQMVEGIVLDVGWYRTTIRSFEREVFVIPNAVFSKNTVLNVTRKMREWRFYEFVNVRVQDVHKVNAIIQDIRRIVRNDGRIINKLHRRIFLDKITHDDVKIYLSFYVEASNRDAFMAVKQDLLLAFVDCVERNGAKLATPRAVLEMDDSLSPTLAGMYGASAAAAAARFKLLPVSTVDVTASPVAPPPAGGDAAPGGALASIDVTHDAIIADLAFADAVKAGDAKAGDAKAGDAKVAGSGGSPGKVASDGSKGGSSGGGSGDGPSGGGGGSGGGGSGGGSSGASREGKSKVTVPAAAGGGGNGKAAGDGGVGAASVAGSGSGAAGQREPALAGVTIAYGAPPDGATSAPGSVAAPAPAAAGGKAAAAAAAAAAAVAARKFAEASASGASAGAPAGARGVGGAIGGAGPTGGYRVVTGSAQQAPIGGLGGGGAAGPGAPGAAGPQGPRDVILASFEEL